MPITITQPRPVPRWSDRHAASSKPTAARRASDTDSDDDDSAGGADLDGDIAMDLGRPSKRSKYLSDIVTPGEVVTDDPQYMRFVPMLISLPCSTNNTHDDDSKTIILTQTIIEVTEPTPFPPKTQPPSSPP